VSELNATAKRLALPPLCHSQIWNLVSGVAIGYPDPESRHHIGMTGICSRGRSDKTPRAPSRIESCYLQLSASVHSASSITV
jgi:hypothetical protein